MNVLNHPNQQVYYPLLSLLITVVGGVLWICSKVLHYQQNTVAYTGSLNSELLFLLDFHVLLV